MGLRDREPQSLCGVRGHPGGDDWDRRLSACWGLLALKRWYGILLPVSLAALAFSLYLAHIEAHLLGVWCIYCVASLGVISVFSLLALGTVLIPSQRESVNHEGH